MSVVPEGVAPEAEMMPVNAEAQSMSLPDPMSFTPSTLSLDPPLSVPSSEPEPVQSQALDVSSPSPSNIKVEEKPVLADQADMDGASALAALASAASLAQTSPGPPLVQQSSGSFAAQQATQLAVKQEQ